LTRLEKILNDTKAMNVQGFVELIDVERLEVQYNNLKTQKESAEKMIGITETLLKFQMGYNISDPIVLTDELVVETESFQELTSGKIDISQRPDYKLMQ